MRFAERFFALVAFALVASAAPSRAQNADGEVAVATGATEHLVAMRDGIELATNVYLPDGAGQWPAILVRTPYGKDSRGMAARHAAYTKRGYAYVVQDCRGKFRSQGDYQPFATDLEDGYDTVEWLAAQPFANGKVGMSGASAMGITTNLAAAADPPHLVAGFVVVAPQSMWEEATFIGGVFKEADVGNWMRRQGAGDQVPGRRATVVVGDEELRRDLVRRISNIDIPMFNLGGWYDIFSIGNQLNFSTLQTAGRPGARGNQKLLMGPFGHGELQGDLEYPNAGGIQLAFDNELRRFDYWLTGENNGIMDEQPVRYYLMASARKGQASPKNGWRWADRWPLATETRSFYLTGERKLEAQPGPNAELSYAFDPARPVPTVGGANLTLPLGPRDQREIGERTDYLRFETAPLAEDLAVVGRVAVELWASTDSPDTDFRVKLVDVYPDGAEALLLDAALRARYRHGRRAEEIQPMAPGKPELLRIDLWSTANVFERGHKLALHVTSSNHPRFEVNPNTGEAPGQEKLPPRVARNTIHTGAAFASKVLLPIHAAPPPAPIAPTGSASGNNQR